MITRPQHTVITCAVTGGVTTLAQTPYLPVTPEQIATSSLEAAEAGAAIVHLHVRNPDGTPSMSVDLYRDTVDRIRKYNTNLLINLTTGPGAYFHLGSPILHRGEGSLLLPAKLRVSHVELIKPDICSVDFNTMHQAGEGIRINHRNITRDMVQRIQAAGVKPELEIFDSGDFRIAQEFIADGTITGTPLWQFAMGVKYGWDNTFEALDYARRQLLPGALWSAFGLGREEMPFVAMTWALGGHVRVGLEDNIYLSKGVLAKTNAELVTKAVRIVNDLGGSVATSKQARELYLS